MENFEHQSGHFCPLLVKYGTTNVSREEEKEEKEERMLKTKNTEGMNESNKVLAFKKETGM